MIKKDFERQARYRSYHLFSVIITSSITFLSIAMILINPARVQADSIPGGNIADPVVSAVDIAKPAVVRIFTTIGGSVTVHFTSTQSATFPLNGGTYKLKLSGSGAFISAHGDILTADHVINPPHNTLDTDLYDMASQDVANYINQNSNSSLPVSSIDALALMTNGNYRAVTHYGSASSDVYLSTDYTGTLYVDTINALGADVHVPVDKIEQESAFDQQDVAIIHVNMQDTASIQLGESLDVKPLDNLTIIGFPGNADVSDKRDPTQELTSSVNKIYVSALKQTDTGAPVIEVGGNIEHGDSGGPALDSNGNIVGVVSFGLAASDPQGTSFLQASSSALTLVQELGLNTNPGPFQKAWQHAFADYTSTKAGHWHQAQEELQQLADKYDHFNAIAPYLNYAQGKATAEQLPVPKQAPKPNYTVTIVLSALAFIVLVSLICVLVLMTRRKKTMPAIPTTPPLWQRYAQPDMPASPFSQRLPEINTPAPDALQAATAYREKNQMWQQQDLEVATPVQTAHLPFPAPFSTPLPKPEGYVVPSGPITEESDKGDGEDLNALSSTAKQLAIQRQDEDHS